jgi:hypothetical protein
MNDAAWEAVAEAAAKIAGTHWRCVCVGSPRGGGVDAHADWDRCPSGRGWIGPGAEPPRAGPHTLAAWFERNWPAEAARITAEALAN